MNNNIFRNWFTAAKEQDELEEAKKCKKEDNTNDVSDDGEGLDKVQPKALKKKFKNRKDKDIDNDGDVDDSDEYIHKKRKAISKDIAKESIKSADKKPEKYKDEKGKERIRMVTTDKEIIKKESVNMTIRDKLVSVLEKKHTGKGGKDAPDAEEIDSKDSPSAKQMRKDHKVEVDNTEEKGHQDAAAAGRKGPSTKSRPNDNKQGDRNIINKIAGAYQKMSKK